MREAEEGNAAISNNHSEEEKKAGEVEPPAIGTSIEEPPNIGGSADKNIYHLSLIQENTQESMAPEVPPISPVRPLNDTLEKSKVENENFNITFKPDTIVNESGTNFNLPDEANQINIFNDTPIPET